MALNEQEKHNTAPPWLKEVAEEVQRSIKIQQNNRRNKMKRMRKVNKLPPDYYHKGYVKEMHRQMLASVDDE
jgi:hypothetical protein|tara:strand:- start:71 stop:286 length:216 start_codon:yes stop_codon:yes gene_type:complete